MVRCCPFCWRKFETSNCYLDAEDPFTFECITKGLRGTASKTFVESHKIDEKRRIQFFGSLDKGY